MSHADRLQAADGFAHDAQTVARIVSRLLRGAHLTAIYVTGDFRLEFTKGAERADTIPRVTCLTMFSDWWVNDRSHWEAFLKTPVAFGAPSKAKEEAMKAYALVCLYRGGAEVKDIALGEDGTLLISTSMGVLAISGQEDVFEESWILEVPKGLPDHDKWSVVCTSTGELLGRPANLTL